MVKLYGKFLEKLGFQKPDATREGSYPRWLMKLPLLLRLPIVLFLAGFGWVIQRVFGHDHN